MPKWFQWFIVLFLVGMVAFAIGGDAHGGAVFTGIILGAVALVVGLFLYFLLAPQKKLTEEERAKVDKLVDDWMDGKTGR